MRLVVLWCLLLMRSVNAGEQTPSLMLYYSPRCPYSQKVLSYLNEIGKSVPMKDVSKSAAAKEELIRLGGKPQVPCLLIDDKPLYEADAIVTWLSEHQNILLPKKEGFDILTIHGNRSIQAAACFKHFCFGHAQRLCHGKPSQSSFSR